MKKDKTNKEPFIHLTKRSVMPLWKSLLIRAISVIAGLLVSGIIAFIFIDKLKESPARIGEFFGCFIEGSFATKMIIWKYLKNTAILLCISLAVTPAFKMRFWNIGAEGQVLIGMLAAVTVMRSFANLPNGLLIPLMLSAALVAGAVWAGITGVFKAIWNTNETLFTLMMNYIATYFTHFVLLNWKPDGTALGIVNPDTQKGWLPTVINKYFIIIAVAVVTAVLLYVYLNYSKHGYELSVVGESENTAKYVGINVKKVIVRTMILSGAICGLVGFLLASGNDHSITINSVGGQGFTSIMVSWLANFNPLAMMGTAALIVLLDMGGSQISENFDVPGALPKIIIGIILLFIIGSEFFINYEIHFKNSKKKTNNAITEGVK